MANAGDVVWLAFPGTIAKKHRPAIILSSDEYHVSRPDVIVGLVTSQIDSAVSTTDHVLSDWRAAGLRVPSAFRAFLASVPQSAVNSTSGRLSPADWNAVQACLKRALAI